MDAEARAVIVDLVHIEAVEAEAQLVDIAPPGELVIEFEPEDQPADQDERERSEASSASRTASVVAPSPPDPDYFVG